MTNKFKIDYIDLVRCLIIAEVVALFFSTALAMIIEVLIFLCCISSEQLRYRIFSELKQPMVIMSLILYTIIGIGIFYSNSPLLESLDMWRTWRKLLLIPVVASVYTNYFWKQRFLYIFISIIFLTSLVSFASYIFSFEIYDIPISIGIVVDNHATQGMFFSVAIFACLVLLRFSMPFEFSLNRFLKLSATLLFLNVIFVTPGRSGYLAIIIFTLVFIYFCFSQKYKLISFIFIPLLIITLLISSPIAKNRIFHGIDEIKKYQISPNLTPMGVRIVMWKNTIDILKHFEHPFFGYGTNGFELAYKKQIAQQNGWQGESFADPHNQYLRILVEYGFIGLLIFLLFILSFFKQKVKLPYYIMGIGVLLAWCSTSMFSPHFTTSGEGRFLMIWCAALLSNESEEINSEAI